MRLIELSANQSSFKRVSFNSSGISLIVGRYTAKTARSLTSTYNGVGKSLIVALIHYCLGSKRNVHFDEHLKGWRFTLRFEHEGQIHEVHRSPGETKIEFDHKELTLATLLSQFKEMRIFRFPAECPDYLTFRSALSFFLRPKKTSYSAFDKPEAKWTDYQSILIQSFLLGLDIHRVVEKYGAKTRLDQLATSAKQFRSDAELRSFYVADRNPVVELAELEASIADLTANIQAFQVAEDYAERRIASDHLHQRLMQLSDEEVILTNLIGDIDSSLQVRADVAPRDLIQLYEEASIALPELVLKRLADVEEFHRRLHENRRKRLLIDRRNAELELSAVQKKREVLQHELDTELQYLAAHRALDEYTENNRYLSELTARRRKIQDYVDLLALYEEQSQRIRLEMGQASLDTSHYLRESKSYLDDLMERFRNFAHELYGAIPSGLVIQNNDGINQLRYNIEAHIPFDAADGINQGKIFCYDLLLLTLHQNHSMSFLFHDNRLFAEMDHRQRYGLFRLADRVCREQNLQYIASVNEDMVESVREVSGADFDRLFVESRILELTDEPGGAGKLLGIQVDMPYESDRKKSVVEA